ncbi:MAG: hypothetical protein GKR94_08105 [Gammaproteobacteria bacterium]|nr:hypothetical protein [Gammaproteobacteria bacterium]
MAKAVPARRHWRAINGLQPLAEGEVRFDGERIDGLYGAAIKPLRRQMAMMFQDPVGSLSPRMRVSDLVLEPFRVHGIDVDRRAQTRRWWASLAISPIATHTSSRAARRGASASPARSP